MLLGMTLGAALFSQSISLFFGSRLERMLGGMLSGMVWGMVVSVSLYRLYFIAKDRKAQVALTKS
jgi:glucose uptake protein GlcU